jgi:hypothetical protein
MKYLGGLSDLYGTVQGAAKALDSLNSISGHLAGVVMQRRMNSLGALGSTSQDPNFGAPTVANVTTAANNSGGTNTITTFTNGTVSVFNPTNGITTNTNSSGQVQQINTATGQDISANYLPENSGLTGAGALASSVGDAVTTLPSTISSAVSAAASAIAPLTTPIITMAVIGIVAYFLLREK